MSLRGAARRGNFNLIRDCFASFAMTIIALSLIIVPARGDDMPSSPYEKATFAGGCFWCMQPFFDHAKGVIKTTVGYTGGQMANPNYEEVSSGETGHAESIEIVYDPTVIAYSKLLDIYWHNIDPTQVNGQFADEGTQYRTVIFYHSDEQKRIAEESKKALAASGRFDKPIVTAIEPARTFYPAEDYHQKYYQKNSLRYNMYHDNSGRVEFEEQTWGKNPQ